MDERKIFMSQITPNIALKKLFVAKNDENADLMAQAVEDLKAFPDAAEEILPEIYSEVSTAMENGTIEDVMGRYRKEIESYIY